ncbi:MAG: TIGR00730 family Rossman fold protein [Bacteroidetes bacterium]|nr:TIGR00730 family Rossman fold protein [Bacteroidota bacterium]
MNICVFCGSSSGKDAIYSEAAKALASALVKHNCTLVYGGGNIGLMGILADEVLRLNGKVIGIIPDFLMKREVGHKGITQLEIVDSMHERKRRMAELADAFIAMPGGWGTLDELAEILTWKQLSLVQEPIGILNTNSFFTHLLAQMKLMAADGFLGEDSLSQLKVANTPDELITLLGVKAN